MVTIDQHAEAQNVSNTLLLKKLISTCKNKIEFETGKRPFDMTDLQATMLLYDVNLSVRGYQELRLHLNNCGFDMPTRNDIDKFKQNLHPYIKSEPLKSSVNMIHLINETIGEIMDMTCEKDPDFQLPDNIYCYLKFGCDGSGSHNKRHQNASSDAYDVHPLFSETDSQNYLAAFITPLLILPQPKENGINDIIWRNEMPNSNLLTRPVVLMRAKENREIITQEIEPYFEVINSFKNKPISVELNEKKVNFHYEIEASMLDGKLVGLVQGDTGAFCHYCDHTRESAHERSNICEGFEINKTWEECMDIWDKLQKGEILYDDLERHGIVHKPLNKINLKYFSITHMMMRSLDNVLKVYYRLISGQHVWSESNSFVKMAIDLAKEKAQKFIKKECDGLLIDVVAHGGGTSNTGNTTMRFFSPKNRDKICSLIDGEETRNNFKKLMGYFNQILTITQSHITDKKVNSTKLKTLGIDLML